MLPELVRDHNDRLVAHVNRTVKCTSDAQDIVQETWIRALRLLEEEQSPAGPIRNLRAYLYRIASNLSIDHLRRRHVRRHLSADTLESVAAQSVPASTPLPDAGIIARESEAAFVAALRRIPARARRVLILSRVEGWTYPRIAAHLGISLRTVSNDMERALAACLVLMADRID